MTSFTKILQPTFIEAYSSRDNRTITVPVFVKVAFAGRKLSITGVEGPRANGDAWGGCGQIKLTTKHGINGDWTEEMVTKLSEIWEHWHLNDMRAGCEHQRAEGWGKGDLDVVSYKLSSKGVRLRQDTIERAAIALVTGEPPGFSSVERALVANRKWFETIYTRPADEALAALYEEKHETRPAGSVYPHEHPNGVLTKRCPTCGYEYGSAWLHEDVPEDVLAWLVALPETDMKPAWI